MICPPGNSIIFPKRKQKEIELVARPEDYQTLGMLLRRKLPLLNAHILHLMFTMAGTLDVSATSVILTSTNKVWPLNSQLYQIKCFLVILDNGQMSLLFSRPKGAVLLELNRRKHWKEFVLK